MLTAKACIVFTTGLEDKVPSISSQLAADGFDVCVAAADQETVEAAQAGGALIPEDVKSCISSAEICIFLIPTLEVECVIAAAGYAGKLGKKIIAVAEEVNSLPQVFDDMATCVVSIGSKSLQGALRGEVVWESPTDNVDGKRNIHRVKCQ